MNWHNLDTFLNMGGFGFYVWSAYGVTAIGLLWMLFSTLKWKKRLIRKHKSQQTITESLVEHASET